MKLLLLITEQLVHRDELYAKSQIVIMLTDILIVI